MAFENPRGGNSMFWAILGWAPSEKGPFFMLRIFKMGRYFMLKVCKRVMETNIAMLYFKGLFQIIIVNVQEANTMNECC